MLVAGGPEADIFAAPADEHLVDPHDFKAARAGEAIVEPVEALALLSCVPGRVVRDRAAGAQLRLGQLMPRIERVMLHLHHLVDRHRHSRHEERRRLNRREPVRRRIDDDVLERKQHHVGPVDERPIDLDHLRRAVFVERRRAGRRIDVGLLPHRTQLELPVLLRDAGRLQHRVLVRAAANPEPGDRRLPGGAVGAVVEQLLRQRRVGLLQRVAVVAGRTLHGVGGREQRRDRARVGLAHGAARLRAKKPGAVAIVGRPVFRAREMLVAEGAIVGVDRPLQVFRIIGLPALLGLAHQPQIIRRRLIARSVGHLSRLQLARFVRQSVEAVFGRAGTIEGDVLHC